MDGERQNGGADDPEKLADATPGVDAHGTMPSRELEKSPRQLPPDRPDKPDISTLPHALRVGRDFGLRLIYILAGTLAVLFLVVTLTEHERTIQMDASLARVFNLAGLPFDGAQLRAPGPSADSLRAALELLKQVQQDQQQQRLFWEQIAQMVLLNLLLPLLTAVFGYVFGRDQSERDERARVRRSSSDHAS